jgi:hypothetical protein
MTDRYTEVDITPKMRAYAERRLAGAASSFQANRGAHQFGSERERTLAGYVGEVCVMKALDIRRAEDGYEFDLLYGTAKLEIKTVSCKFRPPLPYLCTVNSADPNGVRKQAADYYVFVRVLNDLTQGWVLGFLECEEFFRQGKFVKKGDIVAGVPFTKANATILPIAKLLPITLLEWHHQYRTAA